MKPTNVYHLIPNIPLTGTITAAEVIPRKGAGNRLSCHKINIPPHEAYPVHEHPSEHIILVLEGRGWMKCWESGREEAFDVETGDVFFVPAHVPHQVGAYASGATMIATSVDSLPLTDPERLRVVKP